MQHIADMSKRYIAPLLHNLRQLYMGTHQFKSLPHCEINIYNDNPQQTLNDFLDLFNTINIIRNSSMAEAIFPPAETLARNLSSISALYRDYATCRYTKNDYIYVSCLNSLVPRNTFNIVATSRIKKNLYASLQASIATLRDTGFLSRLLSHNQSHLRTFETSLKRAIRAPSLASKKKKYTLDSIRSINLPNCIPSEAELVSMLNLGDSINNELSTTFLLASTTFYINKINKLLVLSRLGSHIFSSSNSNINMHDRAKITKRDIDIATTQDNLLTNCSRIFTTFEEKFKKVHPNSNLTLESFLDCVEYYNILTKRPSIEDLRIDAQEKRKKVADLKKETKNGKTSEATKKELEQAKSALKQAEHIYEQAKLQASLVTHETKKTFEKYFNKNSDFTSTIQDFANISTTYDSFYGKPKFKEHLLCNFRYITLTDTLYDYKGKLIGLLAHELIQQSKNPKLPTPTFGIYKDDTTSQNTQYVFFACINNFNIPLCFHLSRSNIKILSSLDIPYYNSNPIGKSSSHILYPTTSMHNLNIRKYNIHKKFLKAMKTMSSQDEPIPEDLKSKFIAFCLATGDKDCLLPSIIPEPDCLLSDKFRVLQNN